MSSITAGCAASVPRSRRPSDGETPNAADQALAGSEHIIADELVLDVVVGSALTAYDAEFVALASALSVSLVTADKAVLKAFPDRALTMEEFVSR